MKRPTHRLFDLITVSLLLLVPTLFGLGQLPIARTVMIAAAVWIAAYSALTRYLLVPGKSLTFHAHRGLDAATGIALCLAPIVLGYEGRLTTAQWSGHLVLGGWLVLLALLTRDPSDPLKEAQEDSRDAAA